VNPEVFGALQLVQLIMDPLGLAQLIMYTNQRERERDRERQRETEREREREGE
jgi:hypothetical protein